jgi:hypothetical protein
MHCAASITAQNDTVKSSLKYDLGFTRNRNINLWPLFKRTSSRDNYDIQVVAPLFRYHRDQLNHHTHTHVFPLFWSDSTARKQDLRVVSFYYPSLIHVIHDKTAGTHSFKFLELAPYISFFEMTKTREGTIVQNNLFFFILHKENKVTRSSYLICFPVYWSFKTPDKSINTLFPLIWNRREVNGKDTTHLHVLFPLYWSYHDKNEKNRILFPFIWSIRDTTFHSFTFFPLFSSGRSADLQQHYFTLTPFFWHVRKPQSTSNLLFPLFLNRKEVSGKDTVQVNVLFPLFWSYRTTTETDRIFFPFLWSLRDTAFHSFTCFPLFSAGSSADKKENYYTVTPLFWHVKKKQVTRNVLFPLFYSSEKTFRNDTIHWNVLFPVYWSRSDTSRNTKVLFPIIWSFKNPHYRSFTLLPLFSMGHSADRRKSHLLLTPFLWHTMDGANYHNVLFPIVWNKRKVYGIDTLYSTVVFPLLWSHRDLYTHSFTLIPLFSLGRDLRDTSNYTMISPLFWRFKNPREEKDLLFPLFYRKERITGKDTCVTTVFFPIYRAHHDSVNNNKVLFPFYWNLKNRNYQSLTLEPLFSIGHSTDGKRSHLAIGPLFWHFSRPDGYLNTFFPIFWNGKIIDPGDTTRYTVLFPVYWSYHSKYVSRKIYFPLVWSFIYPDRHSFTFFPLFTFANTLDKRSSHFAVTPLFWHFKAWDGYTNVLFPVWWNRELFTASDTSYRNIVFPLYWSYTNNKGVDNEVLFPLLWKFKAPTGNTEVLFPFFWTSETHSLTDTSHSIVLFPFYWSRRNKQENSQLFLPVFHRYESARYHAVSFVPLFSYGRSGDNNSGHLLVTPLFWHFYTKTTRDNILFPLVWTMHRHIGERKEFTRTLAPLFSSYRTPNGEISNQVLFPLIWKLRSPAYRSFTFFPLFSTGHDPGRKKHHLVLTPLFWDIREEKSHVVVLFPLFKSTSDSVDGTKFNVAYFLFRYKQKGLRERFSFLWPLCEYVHDTSYRYFRLAPVVWMEKSADHRYFSIQPFYYHSISRESESYRFFWELFVYQNEFNVKKSRHFLWRVIFSEKYANNDHEFRILHLLYVNVKKNGNTERGIFPIYHTTHEGNGDKSLSVFLGFYHTYRRQIQDSKESYEEVKIFWFIRLLSNYKELKEKGVNVKQIR